MEVDWKSGDREGSILFARGVAYEGINAFHHRVLAGELKEHASDCHEFSVNINGFLKVNKQNAVGFRDSYVSRRGSICMTPAGSSISAEWNDSLEIVNVCFMPEFLEKIAIENGFSTNFDLVEEQREHDPVIQHLGLALIHETSGSNPTSKLYAETITQTLAIHTLKDYSTASEKKVIKGGLTGYRLRNVKDYINDNLEQDITLTELAEVAGLSQYHFSRAFRKSTGLTPRKYLNERRIEKAKYLLSTSDLPIVEVSLATGFKTQSHFTSLFRKMTRFTPRTWREMEHA